MISKSFSNSTYLVISSGFRFLSNFLINGFPLALVVQPCTICPHKQKNQDKNSNPKPLDLPLHPRHRRFMHDIWYVFGGVLSFLASFTICHNFASVLASEFLRMGARDAGGFRSPLVLSPMYAILPNQNEIVNLRKAF